MCYAALLFAILIFTLKYQRCAERTLGCTTWRARCCLLRQSLIVDVYVVCVLFLGQHAIILAHHYVIMSFISNTFKLAENFLENVDLKAERAASVLIPAVATASAPRASSAENSLPRAASRARQAPTTAPDTAISINGSFQRSIGELAAVDHASGALQSRADFGRALTSGVDEAQRQRLEAESRRREAALEDQIKEGFKESAALRATITELRSRLADVDFDAVHKLRTEYDVLTQRHGALVRDYDSLRAASEAAAVAARDAMRECEHRAELAVAENIAAKEAHMAREEQLLMEMSQLTQQMSIHHQQTGVGRPAEPTSEQGTSAASLVLADAVRRLEGELVLERQRYKDAHERYRAAVVDLSKDRSLLEETRRALAARDQEAAVSRQSLVDLESTVANLRRSQSSIANLQRQNADLARENAAGTTELIDLRSKLRAATALLQQEQGAHQQTRASFDDLQRLFAEQQRLLQGVDMSRRESNRTRYEPRHIKSIDSFDRSLQWFLALLQQSSKARLGVALYVIILQAWAFVLVFLHSHAIPHQ